MGRHPFAGVPLTTSETTLEQCIAEFRFAFTANSQRLLIGPPPGAFPYAALSQTFRDMFDRAFPAWLRASERTSDCTRVGERGSIPLNYLCSAASSPHRTYFQKDLLLAPGASSLSRQAYTFL